MSAVCAVAYPARQSEKWSKQEVPAKHRDSDQNRSPDRTWQRHGLGCGWRSSVLKRLDQPSTRRHIHQAPQGKEEHKPHQPGVHAAVPATKKRDRPDVRAAGLQLHDRRGEPGADGAGANEDPQVCPTLSNREPFSPGNVREVLLQCKV